ncbi:4Fe-4S cluster-binding domain-containing protein [Streptomyces albospinus]|uniref:4Fe-4S cluster-binding domain-containing protein n=1 Tax=Streptomyces albospinus TaxID=285515 RepID=UPI0016716C4C
MHRTTEEHERDPIAQMYRGLDAEDTDSAVSVILKLRDETCDVDCLYCYEKRKEAPGGARIDAGQARRLSELFQGRPLTMELHGGEPLAAGRDHLADVLRALATRGTTRARTCSSGSSRYQLHGGCDALLRLDPEDPMQLRCHHAVGVPKPEDRDRVLAALCQGISHAAANRQRLVGCVDVDAAGSANSSS